MLANYPKHKACPGVWLIHPASLQWQKLILPLSGLSTTHKELLVWNWVWCPLPLQCAGALSVKLVLVLCTLSQSPWAHMCISVEGLPSKLSTTASAYGLSTSSSTQISEPWVEECDKKPTNGWHSNQSLLLSAHCPVVEVYVHYHIMQDSLTRIEGCPDLSICNIPWYVIICIWVICL